MWVTHCWISYNNMTIHLYNLGFKCSLCSRFSVISKVQFSCSLRPGLTTYFSDKTRSNIVHLTVIWSVIAISKQLLLCSHYKRILLQRTVVDDSLKPWDHISEIQVKVKYLIEHMLLLHWSPQQIKFNLSWSSLSSHTEQFDTVWNLGFKSCLIQTFMNGKIRFKELPQNHWAF